MRQTARGFRFFRLITTSLAAAGMLASAAASLAASPAPLRLPAPDPTWVVSDSPRSLGGGTWEQRFSFTPASGTVTALQVELGRDHAGAWDASVVAGAAAAQAGKIVESGRLEDGRLRVVVAGVNRDAIPAGELFRVVYRPADGGRGGFRVSETMMVDADGRIVGTDTATAVVPGTALATDLEPHVDLVMESFSVIPGQTTKETVRIGSQDNARPAAVQLDIQFDSSALIFRSVEAGTASTIAGKTVKGSLISPSLLRIIVQGFNTTSIPDGELLKISWQASASVPRGTYSSLECGNSVVVDGLGFVLPMTCHGGPVAYIGNVRCDVNFDGRVDVVDIQAAVNKVTKLSGVAVDVNCNGREDVQDIQQITDGALGLDCPTPGANDCP